MSSKPASRSALLARIDAIDAAIAEWHGASTLAAAKVGAEKARNLITGSTGPGYGDLDGDRTIGGQVDAGLLPGSRGNPVSLRNSPLLHEDRRAWRGLLTGGSTMGDDGPRHRCLARG